MKFIAARRAVCRGHAFASPLSLEGRDAQRLAGLLTCRFIRSPSSQTALLSLGFSDFWALSATTVAGPSLWQIVEICLHVPGIERKFDSCQALFF